MVDYNWENKEERMRKAKRHTAMMNESYSSGIYASTQLSSIYRNEVTPARLEGVPTISVVCKDTVGAAFDCEEGKTVVLNFASHKNPGGMFMNGSRAQEECLCHESYLYNVLNNFKDSYYAENQTKLNKGLYTNAAIYSPNILFHHNGSERYLDVLTCAAPNKGTAQKYQGVSDAENLDVLRNRIEFIVNIITNNPCKNVVLGAFGCGVFKQDPKEVAECFKEEIYKLGDMNIVFAIPDETSDNYKAFKSVFKN